jgi:hypothetical protein
MASAAEGSNNFVILIEDHTSSRRHLALLIGRTPRRTLLEESGIMFQSLVDPALQEGMMLDDWLRRQRAGPGGSSLWNSDSIPIKCSYYVSPVKVWVANPGTKLC